MLPHEKGGVPMRTSRRAILILGGNELLQSYPGNPSAYAIPVHHRDVMVWELLWSMCWRVPNAAGEYQRLQMGDIWIRTEHIWSVRVTVCLQHPCIMCAVKHFLPFLYSLGEPLSYLHKITFGKHLPFSASTARLHVSISVSSRVVALRDGLCQDSMWVFQGWITGCVAHVLSNAQVSLRNVSWCVLLSSLEGLLYLRQVLVCVVFFQAWHSTWHSAAFQALPLLKTLDLLPGMWLFPGRGIWGLPVLSMCMWTTQGKKSGHVSAPLQNVLSICALHTFHLSSLLWKRALTF